MQAQPRALSLAISTALGIFLSVPAHALTITQTSAQRSDQNLSIVDSTADNVPVVSGASSAVFAPFEQFDPNVGVLTAVSVSLGATGTFRQANSNDDVTGSTSLNASWTYFGQSTSEVLAARSGFGTTTVSTTVSKNLALGEDFIGTGNIAPGSSVSYSVSANKISQSDDGTVQTIAASYSRPGTEVPALSNNAIQTLTYSYLLHAAPSFDDASNLMTLTLNFGDVALNSASSLDFTIYNRRLDADQVALDFDVNDILASGDTGAFTTGLTSFAKLQAGSDSNYRAQFAATTLGAMEAIYRLTLADDATVGLAANRSRYELELRLIGRVVGEPPVNGVPEPGVLALLGIGLLGVALNRKRV